MPAALAMADAVERLERQILLMVQATLDGNLSLRGDQAAFKGSYQDIIKAVNDPSLRKELSTTQWRTLCANSGRFTTPLAELESFANLAMFRLALTSLCARFPQEQAKRCFTRSPRPPQILQVWEV